LAGRGCARRSRRRTSRAPNIAVASSKGWFEHGSTIIVFAPQGFALCDTIRDGVAIRMGEPLMRLP